MYLITGGAGFIGSQVAQELAERGDKVVVIDNFHDGLYTSALKRDRVKQLLKPHNIPVVEVDICNMAEVAKVFTKYPIHHVCHLAAWAGVGPSLKQPEIYERVNITGTRIIFDLARQHNIPKVVYASSSSVYGGNTKVPFSEDDRTDYPVGTYAMTKKANENYR